MYKREPKNGKLFHIELEKIVNMLSRNGYPKNFTYRIIFKEFTNRVKRVINLVYEGQEKLIVYLKLPYIGEMSNKVRECIRSKLPGSIQLMYSNSYSKLSHKFGFKDKQPKQLKHNVVYRIINYMLMWIKIFW